MGFDTLNISDKPLDHSEVFSLLNNQYPVTPKYTNSLVNKYQQNIHSTHKQIVSIILILFIYLNYFYKLLKID